MEQSTLQPQALPGPLREVLLAELALGNRIAETARSRFFGFEDTLFILLEYAFLSPQHNIPGVPFREVNDAHYWQSEYYDAANAVVLACKFKQKGGWAMELQ